MAAFDPLEQLHAGAFDPIAADIPAYLLPLPVQIIVQEGVAERSHGQLDRLAPPPHAFAALGDHRRGMEAVGGAAQRFELPAGLVSRGGLGEQTAVAALERLVAAEDE